MNTNLKELINMAETTNEKEGLTQIIKRMLILKQMINIRDLEDKLKQK